MDDTKHNDIKSNTNHSLQSQPKLKSNSKSKVFAVSAASLFIIPSSYTLLSLSPFILSTIPILSSLCVYASSIPQIKEIHTKKSTLNYSHIPFISLLNNAMLWEMYGILSSDPAMIITNAVAISSALLSITVFAKNNNNNNLINKNTIKKHCGYSGLVLLSLLSSYNLHIHDTCDIVSILGSIGCGTALIAYASPLCVMRNVIKYKSTSALSFGLSSTLTIQAATWFCYAWFVTDDIYVWIPCLMGFGAGLVQLSLFAIY